MKKLKWKKKTNENTEKSFYKASIKSIRWEYIVDEREDSLFNCALFFDGYSDLSISNKRFKTIKQAQSFCEKHIKKVAKKLNKFL